MESKRALLCLMCGLVTGAVGAQTTSNWLMQAVSVGLPQSVLVRDAIDSGKYYLCWTDGVDRFGGVCVDLGLGHGHVGGRGIGARGCGQHHRGFTRQRRRAGTDAAGGREADGRDGRSATPRRRCKG